MSTQAILQLLVVSAAVSDSLLVTTMRVHISGKRRPRFRSILALFLTEYMQTHGRTDLELKATGINQRTPLSRMGAHFLCIYFQIPLDLYIEMEFFK